MPIEIRLAEPSDANAIADFDEFNGERSREIGMGTCFVAVKEQRIIGYASYEPRGLLGQPLLTYLCVREEYRRQRVGTSLVKFVQSKAIGRKLLSSTESWCIGTRQIFEQLGWRKVGEISEINKDGSSEWFYAVGLRA